MTETAPIISKPETFTVWSPHFLPTGVKNLSVDPRDGSVSVCSIIVDLSSSILGQAILDSTFYSTAAREFNRVAYDKACHEFQDYPDISIETVITDKSVHYSHVNRFVQAMAAELKKVKAAQSQQLVKRLAVVREEIEGDS